MAKSDVLSLFFLHAAPYGRQKRKIYVVDSGCGYCGYCGFEKFYKTAITAENRLIYLKNMPIDFQEERILKASFTDFFGSGSECVRGNQQ